MSGKQYIFMSGMPRSGSTLLCNILAQNPNIHASGNSGIMDVMFGVRNQWDNLIEFKASPNPQAKNRVLRGILESYYADREQPIIVDKCRGWLSLLEMAENVLGCKAKVIVPVRDLRGILSSFEKLWRNQSKQSQVAQESQFYFDFQSVAGRCNVWMRPDQPVGLAYRRIEDAVHRGFKDRLYFVRYGDLTAYPKHTLDALYDSLGLERFTHDFNNVEQVTHEDDAAFGFDGLHTIRPKVEPAVLDYQQMLGEAAKQYQGPYTWDK